MVAMHAERLALGSETGSLPSGPAGDRQLLASRLPGLVPYLPMWERQRCLAAAREHGEIGDRLLLLEHPHVYTIGRSGDRRHLLADPVTLERIGATYHEVDRGGDITYHGPGQLVGYPIVTLASIGLSVRAYVRGLERAIIETAARCGVAAHAVPGYTGVWVGDDKLAAIGVRVSRGVAYHGFALNVSPDLSYFDYIVPCGIADRGVTSLARLLGRPVSVAEVASVCAVAIAGVFGLECRWTGLPGSDGSLEPGRPLATAGSDWFNGSQGGTITGAESSGHGAGRFPNS